MSAPVRDVVVIGAGISGLTAMRKLTDAGCDALCLEASERVGGRLLTATSSHGALDLGATWLWPNQQRVTRLMREVGIEIFPQYRTGDALVETALALQRTATVLRDHSWRYHGGAALLAQRLSALLPAGTLHMNTAVTRVQSEGPTLLRVDTGTDSFYTRQVIIAVPPALAAARIQFPAELPESVFQLARETPVWMGTATKVVVRYGSPFWRDQGLAGTALSALGPLQEVHDMSGPDGRPAALFGFASARDAAGLRDIATGALAQLRRLFGAPAASAEEIHVQHWSQQKWTAPPHVHELNNYSLLGHPHYTHPILHGRMHWAATETATEHPGHIEGALEAGERAARAALNYLRLTSATRRHHECSA